MRRNKTSWLLILFGALLLAYSVFSYSFTDPNLVLSGWAPYWHFQQWIWNTIFINKTLLIAIYLALIVSLYSCYIILLREFSSFSNKKIQKKHVYIYAAIIAGVLFSYNALSHDVFNYIFNAKMVVVYQENPHFNTALQHPSDNWTRFMHNTHTSAPYGYGWTGISLIPFVLGNQIFSVTWLLFRLFEIVAVGLLYLILQMGARVLFKKELTIFELAVLFLNPLFLLEIISNMHNDLWMMIPGLAAVFFTLKYSTEILKAVLIGGAFLALSISIKFATVVLLVPMLAILIQRILVEKIINQYLHHLPFSPKISHWLTNLIEKWTSRFLPLMSSILLFIPLFLPRSQQFHPWYLVWSMSWLPLIRQRYWKLVLILFSFSSLLRYVPWMYEDGFKQNTLHWQQAITWGLPVLLFFIWMMAVDMRTQKNLSNTV